MARSNNLSVSKVLLTGTILAGTLFANTGNMLSSSDLFSTKPLGTAGELRTELQASMTGEMRGIELTCAADHKKETPKPAEKAKTATKANKKASKETKSTEATCGAKHDTTKSESKAKESKCGQGKCAAK